MRLSAVLFTSPDPQGAIAAALAEALGGRAADAVVLSCAGGDRETERTRGHEILMQLAPPGAKLLVTHDAIAALYATQSSNSRANDPPPVGSAQRPAMVVA